MADEIRVPARGADAVEADATVERGTSALVTEAGVADDALGTVADATAAPGLVVIGSMMTDLTAVAERLPRRGETVMGRQFSLVSGGKGSNQAAMAARMEVPTWMVGCVGSDVFHQVVLDSLRSFSVHTDHVHVLDGDHTGIAHIRVDATGDNDIVIIPNANLKTSPTHVDEFFASGAPAKVLLLQLETPFETALYAAREAKVRGVQVILNPAPAAPLPDEIFAVIDFITPNETEAGVLTGIEVTGVDSAAEAARMLCARGAQHAIVTLGGLGVVHVTGDEVHHYPTFAVSVVDTTAAGDAFTGAFGSALASGRSVPEAIEVGLAAGALTVTKLGAQSSLPTRGEVEALIARGR
ncbi:ribokinase [Alicyclobacillus sp. ALC3]|uniref:ribokinase n=1 Tax=Alicyclobacillus sp. ALC3 TaxID=2796143 RepID=UPI002379E713|nr:ribokinase [Alicyclobacillus sp. ALC3]WDL98258.1 ribokinase [Alicyclobacillus sp. ALC3]